MSPDDVSPSEMKQFDDISDADFEALRAGAIPGDDERLGEIARFAQDLNRAFPVSSTEALEGTHVSAMLATSRLMAANGEVVEAQPRRQPMFTTFMHSRMAKISAAVAAAMLAFAGVAAAGVLPSPLQNAVADAVAPAGINLPGGTEVKATEPAEVPETEATHTDVSVDESATVENDQGENNDNQGEDASADAEQAAEAAQEAADHVAEAAQEAADQAAEAAKEAADHAAEKASENAPEDAASSSNGD